MMNALDRKPGRRLAPAVVAVLCALSAGCTLLTPVQPWQKGALARPEMTFAGDGLDLKNSEHVYQNREAASGGSGVGGGGCGCN